MEGRRKGSLAFNFITALFLVTVFQTFNES